MYDFIHARFIINGETNIPRSLVTTEWNKFMVALGRSPFEVPRKDLMEFMENNFETITSNMFDGFMGLQLRENHEEQLKIFHDKKQIREQSYRQNNRDEINRRERERYASKKIMQLRSQLQQAPVHQVLPFPTPPTPKLILQPQITLQSPQPMLQPSPQVELSQRGDLNIRLAPITLAVLPKLSPKPPVQLPPKNLQIAVQLPLIQLPPTQPLPLLLPTQPQSNLQSSSSSLPQPQLPKSKPLLLQIQQPSLTKRLKGDDAENDVQETGANVEEEEEEEEYSEDDQPPNLPPLPTSASVPLTPEQMRLLTFNVNCPQLGFISSKQQVILIYRNIIACMQETIRDIASSQYPPEYVALMGRIIPQELDLEMLRENEYPKLVDWVKDDNLMAKQILSRNNLSNLLRDRIDNRSKILDNIPNYLRRLVKLNKG